MDRVLGVDVGYGFVKVTDGAAGYIFPSVVGEGHTRPLLRTGLRAPNPVDQLRLSIGGTTYFVGQMAVRHSQIAFRCLTETRTEGNDFLLLFLSAASLFATEPYNNFSVVTGIPPGRMHLTDQLAQQVKGEHRVVIHREQGSEEVVIRINRLVVVPQPLGGYWSQVLDTHGRIRRDAQFHEGRVGIIDIGFRTTDLATIDHGEFVPERSKTVPVGLSAAYDMIQQRLLSNHGIEREGHQLDEAVMRREINVAGRKLDIGPIVQEALAQLATKLLIDVRSAWRVQEYDAILLGGGGGAMLSTLLLPHLAQGTLLPDAAPANSIGYVSWAHRMWGEGSADA